MLVLNLELNRVWGRKTLDGASIAYVVNRYFTLVGVVLVLVGSIYPGNNDVSAGALLLFAHPGF